MPLAEHSNLYILIILGFISLLTIITLALSAATLGTVNKKYNDLNQQLNVVNEHIANLDKTLWIMIGASTQSPTTITNTNSTVIATADTTKPISNTMDTTTAKSNTMDTTTEKSNTKDTSTEKSNNKDTTTEKSNTKDTTTTAPTDATADATISEYLDTSPSDS